ncbi:MAG: hypothetical protein NC911_04680 [Candidatus Omnitrophica bacterium]|nr:hypothetical protein [Candidatus Omnitrophota bacterium]
MPVEVVKVVGCCAIRCSGFCTEEKGLVPNPEGVQVEAVAMATEKGTVLIACPMFEKDPENARITWCKQSPGSDGKPDRCFYSG